jgi:hypothetical protein
MTPNPKTPPPSPIKELNHDEFVNPLPIPPIPLEEIMEEEWNNDTADQIDHFIDLQFDFILYEVQNVQLDTLPSPTNSLSSQDFNINPDSPSEIQPTTYNQMSWSWSTLNEDLLSDEIDIDNEGINPSNLQISNGESEIKHNDIEPESSVH